MPSCTGVAWAQPLMARRPPIPGDRPLCGHKLSAASRLCGDNVPAWTVPLIHHQTLPPPLSTFCRRLWRPGSGGRPWLPEGVLVCWGATELLGWGLCCRPALPNTPGLFFPRAVNTGLEIWKFSPSINCSLIGRIERNKSNARLVENPGLSLERREGRAEASVKFF